MKKAIVFFGLLFGFIFSYCILIIPVIIIMILSVTWSLILGERLNHMSMHIFNRWLKAIGEFLEYLTWVEYKKRQKLEQ